MLSSGTIALIVLYTLSTFSNTTKENGNIYPIATPVLGPSSSYTRGGGKANLPIVTPDHSAIPLSTLSTSRDFSDSGSVVAKIHVRSNDVGIELALRRCTPPLAAEPATSQPLEPVLYLGTRNAPLPLGGELLKPDSITIAGEYQWDDVVPGTWCIVGLPQSEFVPEAPFPLLVRPGELTVVNLQLSRAGVIRGVLEFPDGSPVANANVRTFGPILESYPLDSADPGDQVGITSRACLTDAAGGFEVTGLPLGLLFGIHAWTDTGARSTTALHSTLPSADPYVLQVSLPVELVVRVLDSQSRSPISGVIVYVMDHRLNALSGVSREHTTHTPLRASMPTDADGITHVVAEPGSWLVVTVANFDVATQQVSLEGATMGTTDMLLDPPGISTVRVTTPSGVPIADAAIECVWGTIHPAAQAIDKPRVLRSNSLGEVFLADLGFAHGEEPATIRLYGHHAYYGIGGVEIDYSAVSPHSFPRSLILRPPGKLELVFTPAEWCEPTDAIVGRYWTQEDVDESDIKALAVEVTLRFLGNETLRREFSRQDGVSRSVLIGGVMDDEHRVVFNDLEPGFYAIEVVSTSRQIVFSTPTLRIVAGESLTYWVRPPSSKYYGRVVFELRPPPAVDESDTHYAIDAMLVPLTRMSEGGAMPYILPSIVAETAVRRSRIDVQGVAEFSYVPPGRYVVGIALPGVDGTRSWLQTAEFVVYPGDYVHVTDIERHDPPLGVLY